MNNNSKTKNILLNLVINFMYQFIIFIISFFSRRIFIKSLGIDYLGISSLFSNILEIFALAELGIGSAISFSMYKYLVNRDKKKLRELITYYKKLYNKIACFIFVIGIAFLPFLKYIIKLDAEVNNIEVIYLIFLINSVFSYLFVYKSTIVYADQCEYKLKCINIVTELVKNIFQIISLIVLKNYIVYLLIQIVSTLIGNILKNHLAEKWYPFIKDNADLPESEKKEIWSDIKSMSCYKFGNAIMNNTDNILTSILVSTTMVGIYSNYMMIYLKISSFINLIFSSLTASVGNLNVFSTNEKKYELYKLLRSLAYILFAIASIGIWFVADDVVKVMTNSYDFLLNKSILVVIVINYYLMGVLHPNTIFRQTSGLFKYAKYSMLICSILNCILSIILGVYFGLFGIILASIVSRVLTNIWYEPYVLYTKFFNKNPKEYYINEIFQAILVIVIIVFLTPIIKLINFDNIYINIVLKTIICGIIPFTIIYFIYRKSSEYIFFEEKIKSVLKNLKKNGEIL